MNQIELLEQQEVDSAELLEQTQRLINQQLTLIPFSPIEKIEDAGRHICTDCFNVYYMSIRSTILYRQFNSFERKIDGEHQSNHPIRGTTDELWDYCQDKTENFEYGIPASYHFVTCKHCDGNGKVRCGKCSGSGKVTERRSKDVEGRCKFCNGTGRKQGSDWEDCPQCNGRGKRFDTQYFDVKVECPRCDGTGIVTCDSCAGQGMRLRGLKLQQSVFEDFRIVNVFPTELLARVPMLGIIDGEGDGTQFDLVKDILQKNPKENKKRPQDDSVLGNTELLLDFDLTELNDPEEDLPEIFCGDNAEELLGKMMTVYSGMLSENTRCGNFYCRVHEKKYFRYVFTPDKMEAVKDKDQEMAIYASLQDQIIYAEETLKVFASNDLETAQKLLKDGNTEESLHIALIAFFKSGKNQEFRNFINKQIIGFKEISCYLLTILAFAGTWYYFHFPKGGSFDDIKNYLSSSNSNMINIFIGGITALTFMPLLCFCLSWKLKSKLFKMPLRNLIFTVAAGFSGGLVCKLCEWMNKYQPNQQFYWLLLGLVLYFAITGLMLSPTLRTILRLKIPEISKMNGAAKAKAIEQKVLKFSKPMNIMDFIIVVDIPIIITAAIAVVCLFNM